MESSRNTGASAAVESNSVQLNLPQQQAVAHTDGPLLVLAGAGSGKTRVIVYRIAQLIALSHVAPFRILAVTFTNKAAKEMRSRIEQIVGPDIARELWMGTFHATCARLLRLHHDEVGLTRNFVIYDSADQLALMNRVANSLDIDPREYPAKWLLSQVHGRKQHGLEPQDITQHTSNDRVIVRSYEEYQQALRTSNAVDFDDLILYITRLAENPASRAGHDLRHRFRYLLVDEFQDVNSMQYRLVRALATHHDNVCVVGDDDQSIYRWRGADVRIIRGFQQDYSSCQVVKLEQNYRSTGNIVRVSLAVIAPSTERQPKDLFTDNEDGAPVRIIKTATERDEADTVVNLIRQELRRGTPAQQIAVFYRLHAQSRVLEEALRVHNVPYQIIGGTRFFDRAEVKDILAYLRVITNPQSDVDLLRIINVPARRIGTSTINKLVEAANSHNTSVYEIVTSHLPAANLSSAAKKSVTAFATLMEALRKDSSEASACHVVQMVIDRTGYAQTLRELDNAEADARLNNLKELVNSLAEFEEQAHATGESDRLDDYLQQVSLVSDVDQHKNLPTVSLMTIHAAKGLEFDCVFVTGLEEDLLPYRSSQSLPLQDNEEEERRLAYVAFSRARQRLTITYACSRMVFGTTRYGRPSQFLGNLPEQCIVTNTSPHVRDVFRTPSRMIDLRNAGFFTSHRSRDDDAVAAVATGAVDTSQPNASQRYVQIDNPSPFPCLDPLGPGSRVLHARFGQGQVLSVSSDSPPVAVVLFENWGTRRVVVKYLHPVD